MSVERVIRAKKKKSMIPLNNIRLRQEQEVAFMRLCERERKRERDERIKPS